MKRLLALCLLLALLLCACSAAGQPTQATQQPTEETAAAPTETAAAPKTFGLSYLPEHGFNPYTCTATVNRAAFSLLYESLFVVSSHFRAEPVLCESFTASEDGKDLSLYPCFRCELFRWNASDGAGRRRLAARGAAERALFRQAGAYAVRHGG